MTRSRAPWPVRVMTRFSWRIRAIPGMNRFATTIVDMLRDSDTARKVFSRLFDTDVTGLSGAVFLKSGTLIAGHGRDNLPVVLISLVGVSEAHAPALLERIAQEQVLTGGFRPVIVIDSNLFSEVRQYGWAVDHVIPQDAWYADQPWNEYISDRLIAMRRTYQAVALLDITHASDLSWLYLHSLTRRYA